MLNRIYYNHRMFYCSNNLVYGRTFYSHISNLITDMTIKGAPINEVVRAVKHSMVVIDSVKHELNYKQSYLDNGIAALKKTYQGKADAGAATLISRASSQKRINEIDDARSKVDPVTGRKIYFETGATTVQRRKLSASNWVNL